MDDFNDKIDSYQLILEIEDWLGIKHNPQILKECWYVMNDYYCDLQQMRDEIIYSELEDYNMVDEDDLLKEAALTTFVEHIDDLEKKREIEEAYKELESVDESIRKQHQSNVNVGTIINLRKVDFGGKQLTNVKASVVKNQKAPLLLGQSVLGRLGKIEIDNSKHVLKITTK